MGLLLLLFCSSKGFFCNQGRKKNNYDKIQGEKDPKEQRKIMDDNFVDFDTFSAEEIEALKVKHAAENPSPPAPIDPNAPKKTVYIRLATTSSVDTDGKDISDDSLLKNVVSHELCANAHVARVADGSELWDMHNYDILDIFEQMGFLVELPNMLSSMKIVVAVPPTAEVLANATAPFPAIGDNLLAPEYEQFTIGNDTLFELQ